MLCAIERGENGSAQLVRGSGKLCQLKHWGDALGVAYRGAAMPHFRRAFPPTQQGSILYRLFANTKG